MTVVFPPLPSRSRARYSPDRIVRTPDLIIYIPSLDPTHPGQEENILFLYEGLKICRIFFTFNWDSIQSSTDELR